VVDDYGHHPTEIRATLAAARECGHAKSTSSFQPHRYTRTRDLMDEFCNAFTDADTVIVLPIYAASEEPIPGVTAPDEFADVVLSNSVLHFARDDRHFRAMLAEMWRVLKPGGMFFCRLGSRIGMDFERVRDNIFLIPDGSKWFLVDQQMLLSLTEELKAVQVDPLKTTIVQDYRCMTTWVLRKRRS
jgi:SAM-dependent methyltransferase